MQYFVYVISFTFNIRVTIIPVISSGAIIPSGSSSAYLVM